MPLFDPQQLRRLDWCSPEFPNYLASTFHEQGYRDYVAGLQDEGSALLIEYLDNVSPLFYVDGLTTDACIGPRCSQPHKSCLLEVLVRAKRDMWPS